MSTGAKSSQMVFTRQLFAGADGWGWRPRGKRWGAVVVAGAVERWGKDRGGRGVLFRRRAPLKCHSHSEKRNVEIVDSVSIWVRLFLSWLLRLSEKYCERATDSNILIDCRSLHQNHIGQHGATGPCLTWRPFLSSPLCSFPLLIFKNPFNFFPVSSLLFCSLSFSVFSRSSQNINFFIQLISPTSFCLPSLVKGSGSRCLLAPRGTDLPLSDSTVGRWVAAPPSKPREPSRDSGFVFSKPATQNACKSASQSSQGLL